MASHTEDFLALPVGTLLLNRITGATYRKTSQINLKEVEIYGAVWAGRAVWRMDNMDDPQTWFSIKTPSPEDYADLLEGYILNLIQEVWRP